MTKKLVVTCFGDRYFREQKTLCDDGTSDLFFSEIKDGNS